MKTDKRTSDIPMILLTARQAVEHKVAPGSHLMHMLLQVRHGRDIPRKTHSSYQQEMCIRDRLSGDGATIKGEPSTLKAGEIVVFAQPVV